jgi:hypothetical protein
VAIATEQGGGEAPFGFGSGPERGLSASSRHVILPAGDRKTI